jgi:hypothetical protein
LESFLLILSKNISLDVGDIMKNKGDFFVVIVDEIVVKCLVGYNKV